MVIASTLCSSCKGHNLFDSKKSSTYKADSRTWQILYGDGSTASGIVAKDTVNIGGLNIKGQTIGLAKQESPSFTRDVVDGLVGLGFDTITTVKGIKTPVYNVINQKLITSPVFGVYLGKASQGGGGEYLFGAANKARYTGSLATVPVDSSHGYWGVIVDGLKVGTKTVTGSFDGILDTGTTLLLFTHDMAQEVAKVYGAKDNNDGTFTINCDTSKFKPLIFEKNGNHCLASFGFANLDFAILGDVFLKNNYAVFNEKVPSVQIAPAKHS